jgi:nucleoid-associated protein YgaU
MRDTATLPSTVRREPRRPHRLSQRTPSSGRNSSLRGKLEVLLLAAIVALLVIGAVSTGRPREASPYTTSVLRVRQGDTLWQVAEAHPIDGLTTSQVVDALVAANRLGARSLSPGQMIRIPANDQRTQMASR